MTFTRDGIKCDECGRVFKTDDTNIEFAAEKAGWTSIVNIRTGRFEHYCPQIMLVKGKGVM